MHYNENIEMEGFLYAYCPLGSLDIAQAIKIYLQAYPNSSGEELAYEYKETMEELNIDPDNGDIIAFVYDKIFLEAISVIDKLENTIELFCNYIDTHLWIIHNKRDEFTEIMREYYYKISGEKLKKSIDLEELIKKVKQHKNCDTEIFNLLNLLEY